MNKQSLILILSTVCLLAQAQKTISTKTSTPDRVYGKHNVMLIPFEPRLYMGEIDYQIAHETKLSSAEIRHRFRDGLNEQLNKKFRSQKYGVVDLMDDTAKFAKDTHGIYQYLSYNYMKVPDQNNYKPPVKEKKSKSVEKGQITVETNSDRRFMNARITNAKVVPMLYGKYKTDIFVFVNQLDIKASGSPDATQIINENPNRKIVVHYTVYTYDAKEINSGIAEVEFDSSLNNPKKIIDKHFATLASTIVDRVHKALLLSAK
jgi:hypothetical protein